MKITTAITDLLPKLINYRLARRGHVRPTGPINLTLSVTNMCQSRCKTCNIWELYHSKGNANRELLHQEMTLSDYERLFKSLGHVYFVNISGGEPFLRKDLPEIIEMANTLLTPGVIHTPTNAIMPEKIENVTADILQRLKDSGRDVVFTMKPSFDGVGALHDEIRGVPGNFQKLLDTLQRLMRLRDRFNNLEVGAGTVISNCNIRAIRETAQYVNKLDLDSYISEIAEVRSEMFNSENKITPVAEQYEGAIRAFAQEREKHSVTSGKLGHVTGAFRSVYYDLVVEILKEEKQVLPCYAGISNVHISVYGDVWPCCILGYEYSFGKLSDADYDFWSIWHSERAQEIRRHIRDGNCWCPLANQAYSNMLLSPSTLTKVVSDLIHPIKHNYDKEY